MAKKKKKSTQYKKQSAVIQKSDHLKKYIAEKNEKKDNKPDIGEDNITHILFGHAKIDKKDIIEIIIVIIFVVFLVFMHLKTNDII